MKKSQEISEKLRKEYMREAKIAHSVSFPVIRYVQNKYWLAVFVVFFKEDDARNKRMPRPSAYCLADIESGRIKQSFRCDRDRINDFTKASFSERFDVTPSKDTVVLTPEYLEKMYSHLDDARKELIEFGSSNARYFSAYEAYFDMLIKTVPTEFKRFYEELSRPVSPEEAKQRSMEEMRRKKESLQAEKKEAIQPPVKKSVEETIIETGETEKEHVIEKEPIVEEAKTETSQPNDTQINQTEKESVTIDNKETIKEENKEESNQSREDVEPSTQRNSTQTTTSTDWIVPDNKETKSKQRFPQDVFIDFDAMNEELADESQSEREIREKQKNLATKPEIKKEELRQDKVVKTEPEKKLNATQDKEQNKESPSRRDSFTRNEPPVRREPPMRREPPARREPSARREVPSRPETQEEWFARRKAEFEAGLQRQQDIKSRFQYDEIEPQPDPLDETVRLKENPKQEPKEEKIKEERPKKSSSSEKKEIYTYKDIKWEPQNNLSSIPEKYFNIVKRIAEYIEFLPCDSPKIRYEYPVFCFKDDISSTCMPDPWQALQITLKNAELKKAHFRIDPNDDIYISCGQKHRCMFASCPYAMAAYYKYLLLTDKNKIVRQRKYYEDYKQKIDMEDKPSYQVLLPANGILRQELEYAKKYIENGLFGNAKMMGDKNIRILSVITTPRGTLIPEHEYGTSFNSLTYYLVETYELMEGLAKRGRIRMISGKELPRDIAILSLTDWLMRTGQYEQYLSRINMYSEIEDTATLVVDSEGHFKAKKIRRLF